MSYQLVAEGIGQASESHEEAAEELADEYLRRHHMDIEDAYKAYQAYQRDPNSDNGKVWSQLEAYANQVLYGEMYQDSHISLEVMLD